MSLREDINYWKFGLTTSAIYGKYLKISLCLKVKIDAFATQKIKFILLCYLINPKMISL